MRSAILSVIALAILFPTLVSAALVTPDEAREVGTHFLNQMTVSLGSWGGADAPRITDCVEVWRDGLLLGYHLPVEPAGYIFVPSTRLLFPVKSFSFSEDSATDSEAGYWLVLKDALEQTLLAIEDRYGDLDQIGDDEAPADVRAQWEAPNRLGFAPTSLDTVGPLVMTKWEQGVPFNDSCPQGDGGTCVVGCVATAACQVMRYWRHPSCGTGSHSYYWDGDQSCGGSYGGGTLSANYGHAYDWWNMKRSYTFGYTPEQAAAVAQLSSDVGIAWNMDYGVCGSAANTADGRTVYPTYFKYLSGITRQNRSNYATADAWFARLREEFDADPPRPIHYRIYGHSIVCDGYITGGGTNYIHLNYGWGGSSDNWYAVDNLHCPWSGCDPMVEYALCGIQPGADFIDVTSGPLGDTGNSYGVAWGDYDGDGDQDLYVVNSGTANRLLRNDGGGAFTDVTAPPLGDASTGRAAAWADYDNDGDLDLYLCNTSGQANKLFRNDINDIGIFTDVTAGPLGDTGNTEDAAWADVDNDGDVDLYLVNNGSANRLLVNYYGTFIDQTPSPLGDAGSGYSAVWGDYDGDNDLDLYLVKNGANMLFRNDGGSFTDVTAGPLGDTGNGRAAAWGDYDNDADLDIYITNYGTANRLLRNDGLTGFVDVTSGPLGDTGNSMGTVWLDVDNDGDIDIYLANEGANKVLRNRGADSFQDATVTPLGDSGVGKGVAAADYDGDGRPDLYLANTGGTNRLFHNEYQPDNHWLRVRLVGTSSNAAGIGARVRVVAGGMSQVREISGGSGYCSQSTLVAEFGLGAAATADTIEVTWPYGSVEDTVAVAANQTVTITESDMSGLAGPAEISPEPVLLGARPNPFRASTTIRFALATGGRVSLKVFDIRGRLVSTLLDGESIGTGEQAVDWNGKDAQGRDAAPGLYFARLESGALAKTHRLIHLK
jgi:hypothetical protein